MGYKKPKGSKRVNTRKKTKKPKQARMVEVNQLVKASHYYD